MDKPAYTLTDAAKLAKEYPQTFTRPESFRLDLLAPGDAVKLCFSAPGVRVAERMWVRITSREGDRMTGELKNDPSAIPLLRGELVAFEPRHVYDLLVDPARTG